MNRISLGFRCPCSGRRAFSLVQLLVSIGIIAVLASMIFVVLGNAKNTSNSVKCSANLRQIGMAMHLYTYENDGYLPKPSQNYLSESAPSVSWMIIIGDYIKLKFPGTNEDTFFLCPSALESYPNGNARRTYAMNAAGTDSHTAIRLFDFQKPSDTVLLYDAVSNPGNPLDSFSVFGINTYRQHIEYRHNGSANLLFMDGHVGPNQAAELNDLQSYVTNFTKR